MKVLVATQQTQGAVQGDYHWTVDGELVTALTAQCRSADRCGCARGFPGLASARATTTAMVVDLPHIDDQTLRGAVVDSLHRQGGLSGLSVSCQLQLIDAHLDVIDNVCRAFPAGFIVRRKGDEVWSVPTAT